MLIIHLKLIRQEDGGTVRDVSIKLNRERENEKEKEFGNEEVDKRGKRDIFAVGAFGMAHIPISFVVEYSILYVILCILRYVSVFET